MELSIQNGGANANNKM